MLWWSSESILLLLISPTTFSGANFLLDLRLLRQLRWLLKLPKLWTSVNRGQSKLRSCIEKWNKTLSKAEVTKQKRQTRSKGVTSSAGKGVGKTPGSTVAQATAAKESSKGVGNLLAALQERGFQRSLKQSPQELVVNLLADPVLGWP